MTSTFNWRERREERELEINGGEEIRKGGGGRKAGGREV